MSKNSGQWRKSIEKIKKPQKHTLHHLALKSKFKCLFLSVTARGMAANFQHKLKNIYLNISTIIQKQEPIIYQQVRHILRKTRTVLMETFLCCFLSMTSQTGNQGQNRHVNCPQNNSKGLHYPLLRQP